MKNTKEIRREFISKVTLKERGWTDSLIRQFYPVPEKEVRNPHYSCAAPMKLYDLSRVKDVEKNENFIRAKEKIKERTLKALKSREPKEIKDQRSRDFAKSLDIGLPIYERNELIGRALETYKTLASICGPAEVKLAKISKRYLVEHCRKHCMNYEELLQKKFGKTRAIECSEIFEERIGKTVEELYPWIGKTLKETRRFLFIDTETTGLNSYVDHLVQVAWVLTDELDKEISSGNFLIYPDNFKIPMSATAIHGITTKRAKDEGVPLKDALMCLIPDWKNATDIVGHSVGFDIDFVEKSWRQLAKSGFPWDYNVIDTAVRSTPYCQLESESDYYEYRTPSLLCLHRILFNKTFDDAHDAMADTQATRRCFWELNKRGVINL